MYSNWARDINIRISLNRHNVPRYPLIETGASQTDLPQMNCNFPPRNTSPFFLENNTYYSEFVCSSISFLGLPSYIFINSVEIKRTMNECPVPSKSGYLYVYTFRRDRAFMGRLIYMLMHSFRVLVLYNQILFMLPLKPLSSISKHSTYQSCNSLIVLSSLQSCFLNALRHVVRIIL